MVDQRKVVIWRLLLLSACGGASDLGYAIQASYAVPILQGVGISLKFATILLSVSPILGMLFQPFLGAVSDQCTSPFGKRKPFILFFSLTAMVGCSASYATYLIGISVPVMAVRAMVVALVALFDFSIGQLQFPNRAFLLDVIPLSQSQTGNFIFTLVILVYTTAGFALGAVPWSEMFGEGFAIEYQAQIVFGLGGLIILLSMLSTLCSIREPQMIILSADANNDDSGKNHNVAERTPLLESNKSIEDRYTNPKSESTTSFYNNKLADNHPSTSAAGDRDDMIVHKHSKCCNCGCSVFEILKTSITDILSFVYHMSYSMWIIWLVSFFGYFGEFAFSYGFTTFVGTVIYNGDSEASHDTDEYRLYTKGVRMGSLALAASAVFGGFVSIGLDLITKWICTLKTALLFSLGFFVLSLFLMIILQEFYFIVILALSYGPVLALLLAVPFAVIPIYEVS